MGSWIITLTYFLTSAYLIYEGKRYQPLNLVGCMATALILCFCGLLFTGALSYAVAEMGAALENEIVLGVMVSIGVVLSLLVRHFWNRSRR